MRSDIPGTWQQLEEGVAQILEQCGFAVEHKKVVDTARGRVELDVFAEETVDGRRNVIICECKNWDTNIPQNVAHAFRTVVQDMGGNVGYIVSKRGFQPGAVAAVAQTNIKLVTWLEFQDAFLETWYEKYFVHRVKERFDPLIGYAEPFAPRWLDRLTEDDEKRFIELRNANVQLGWLLLKFHPATRILPGREIPELPIRPRLEELNEGITIQDEVLDASSFVDLLSAFEQHATPVIEEIAGIKVRNGIE